MPTIKKEQNLGEEVKKVLGDLQVPRILVAGRTGVGKSTLINAIFGVTLARTGAGLPVTQEFGRYPASESEYSPVIIYDSPGYEAERELEWLDKVINFLEYQAQLGIKDRIHLVWYVINASSARVEYFEIDIIKKLNEQNIPVVIVLSQCDRARESEIKAIEETIKSYQLEKNYDILEVAAEPLEIRGRPICDPFGLKELLNKTIELLPDIYTDAMIAAQIVDLKAKRKLAWTYIAGAAVVSFGSGFIPIPGLTPAVAISTQLVLCLRIATIYGYADLAKILSSIQVASISSLFNILSTGVLDLLATIFPPSAALSGGVAATFITVLGLTTASVFEKLARSHIYTRGKEEIEDFLRKTFREELRKYAKIKISSKQDLEKVGSLFISEIDN